MKHSSGGHAVAAMSLPKPLIKGGGPLHDLCKFIAKKDYGILSAPKTAALLEAEREGALEDWAAFQASWNQLELDGYMKDGGTYRYRRHAVYSAEPFSTAVQRAPDQPHYQSLDYNTLNGDIARHYAPITPAVAGSKVLGSVLALCQAIYSNLAPYYAWHIEVHQFRIYAQPSGGLPTPEGIHRDGVSFVFMMLVNRVNVLNGETGIYDRQKRRLANYTLSTPMEAALVNDERTMHGVSPILALDPDKEGYRDVLVVTFNKC
ncbi:Uncharacterized protein conserved in bacteria [Bordetella ansorpii]|uniref:Uncharacterized protein conserved in bacteria n=1 Tax=Bordetella ansorpii TaxID=288768 RepID=A0A157QL66_9BORD|nr:2OG-Fe dioxygenase family protein [Bordetella ansorpii]SAI46685.1 Uncharacterized protein conserved in bacteria [Bordetella ansorpii]